MKERELIKIIHDFCKADNNQVIKGIGDDCAVVAKDDQNAWLITMDTLVEHTHFNLDWHCPEKLGRKCVSVNVSDIAAMGGKPSFVLLSLGMPSGFDENWFKLFSRSLVDACKEYGCLLIGGDTVKTTESIMISLTVIGEAVINNVIYRSGAQIDDVVWVDAPLGLAAAGLELCMLGMHENLDTDMHLLVESHLNPDACLDLGVILGKSGLVSSMMDISDGVATDLAHLCTQSGVGALIHADKLLVHKSLQRACAILDQDPLKLILGGGEDYHLLFTVPAEKTQALLELVHSEGFSLYPIGVIEQEKGIRLLKVDAQGINRIEDVSFQGFDHF